ncbi:1-deoxy-D-xylulose-5-phosphate reductoisomerase [Candidatus Arthromitus sp. SFB-rat-Yit]|uniref:1-deoxy-D-xylulose-5-phosphate reductoisomerase n=1 Tax=Candidatus Arthromitus sp. SFB-rat-Yit TaxID=1041504 RepID=UPI000227A4D7|nr:1-deoxy-D-xylulose-5-phosphate reductoisomerase [Candidatus Arthromitus sp. SFB-rat-Yit]BAK80962.1 1-deoxy-D-xylulose 5-phosphate reductoisomerase [Candidatus Arthromitus sp. SFB-rat-Yit]
MKNISILGATGSIGIQSLDVIKNNPHKFKLNSISIGENIAELRKILKHFSPELVCLKNKNDFERMRAEYPTIKFTYGNDGLLEIATFNKSNIIINGLVGNIGLLPTIHAIESHKNIALANKETLVTAGHIINQKVEEYNVDLIPIDSEHSAIFQALNGENHKSIKNLILTASGGSFRDKTRDELKNVSIEDALKHPNWSMGAKITIDSATMANKGLEIIETHFLFNVDYQNIKVILHRESIIHSMVEFDDSTIIAQLGTPDMRVPIQYALTYPDRIQNKDFKALNFEEISSLNFSKLDFERYPCVKMAFEAGKLGGTATTIFNSSNEEAVRLFLNKKISFLDIELLIEKSLSNYTIIENPDLNTIIQLDKEVKSFVYEESKKI